MIESMRTVFEEWADDKGYDLLKNGNVYDDPSTGNAWVCWQDSWQASRAAIEIEMNINTVGIHGRYVEKNEVIRLITDAGINVKKV
ncbi:hypothetical protein [Pantoea sp. App145]|uniref:hypothetical protein n=1 Tax=Pantoea sp. App145 TaxID=3071567 RepID=UPI003A8001C3